MTVNDIEVRVMDVDGQDYICITDMIKAKEGDFFIADWLRNRNTLEFLSTWEKLHNPDFNYGEFATITTKAGLNSFKMSVKEWVGKTGAVGVVSKAGRYGGTDAVKDVIIPKSKLPEDKKSIEYAKEADIINVALFGCTSKEWKMANPKLAMQNLNIRDTATINELAVLSTLESYNADMIRAGKPKEWHQRVRRNCRNSMIS